MPEPIPETNPIAGLPPVSPANPLLAGAPFLFVSDVVTGPTGEQFVVITIRTQTGETTIFTDRDSAMQIGQQIRQTAGRVSPLTIAPAGSIPLLNGHKP